MTGGEDDKKKEEEKEPKKPMETINESGNYLSIYADGSGAPSGDPQGTYEKTAETINNSSAKSVDVDVTVFWSWKANPEHKDNWESEETENSIAEKLRKAGVSEEVEINVNVKVKVEMDGYSTRDKNEFKTVIKQN